MARHYDVLPALEVRSSLVPSHGDLQRCLLRLDLDNSQVLLHTHNPHVCLQKLSIVCLPPLCSPAAMLSHTRRYLMALA